MDKRCFPPVVDQHTHTLILGSLPGDQSLKAAQYYANPQNQFWRLMSEVTGQELVPLDYPSRLAALLSHGIGLWDVVAQARRPGSLDSSIRERNDNDLSALVACYPHLRVIAFNGGTAARLGIKVLGDKAATLTIVALPSSSPAYTLPYAEKALRWKVLADAVQN